MAYWYDGQWLESNKICLELGDPGLLYGATLFTTLRIWGGDWRSPRTAWSLHQERLSQSLTALGWSCPDWDRLHQGLERLSALYPVVRVTLFADGREWLTGRSLPADLADKQQRGIIAWLVPPHQGRSLGFHKTGNYLGPWQALRHGPRGTQEGILTAIDGRWLETCTGNLWGWGEGQWWTPPLTGEILPGIARQQITQYLRERGVAIGDRSWSQDWSQNLEWIGYSNSVVGLIPIREIPGLRHWNITHPALNTLEPWQNWPH